MLAIGNTVAVHVKETKASNIDSTPTRARITAAGDTSRGKLVKAPKAFMSNINTTDCIVLGYATNRSMPGPWSMPQAFMCMVDDLRISCRRLVATVYFDILNNCRFYVHVHVHNWL
jgi:hypothetical protein